MVENDGLEMHHVREQRPNVKVRMNNKYPRLC